MYLLIHVLIDSMKKSLPPPQKNGVYIYVYMLLKCTTIIKCNFFQNQTKCFIHTFLNDHFNIYLKCTSLIINIQKYKKKYLQYENLKHCYIILIFYIYFKMVITQFSPKCLCPFLQASTILLGGFVFDTATSLVGKLLNSSPV